MRIITDCRGLSGYQTPRELETHENNMSVAIAQPHRRGSQDPRLESALGRFCIKPRSIYENGLGDHCYSAGVRYREIKIEARQARGIPGGQGWGPAAEGQGQDDQAIIARKEVAELNESKSDDAIRFHRRLYSQHGIDAMVRLCVDERDPPPEEDGLLIRLLSRLAILYGMAPRYFS